MQDSTSTTSRSCPMMRTLIRILTKRIPFSTRPLQNLASQAAPGAQTEEGKLDHTAEAMVEAPTQAAAETAEEGVGRQAEE